MAIEIEKKYRLPLTMIDKLRTSLEESGAQFVGREREENIIYRGGALDEKGAILRIRKTDNKIMLTYKRRVEGYGDVKHQIENECEVNDADAIHSILAELDLSPRLIYEKHRETWKFRSVEIVIDELPFGWFIEAEGSLTAIKEAEILLDLDELETVHETYPQLTATVGMKNGDVIEARF